MAFRYGVSRAAALLLGLLAAACTVTADDTPAPGSCRTADATVVTCASPTVGYSCTGAAVPSQATPSLKCGAGLAGSGGATLFCCGAPVTAACAVDTSVEGCPATQTGYSCTGADAPSVSIGSLTCGTGAAGTNDKTNYCCVTTTTADACASDGTVTGCTGTAKGYSCTGTATPGQTDTTLTCVAGTGGTTGKTTFCCSPPATPDKCAADTAITGCAAGTAGYSCTGSLTPTQADSTLACSTGTPGPEGATDYCCSATATAGTCATDSVVTGCTAPATGYSCTGTGTPPQSNSALTCSPGVDDGAGKTDYCCAVTTSTCAADGTVTGCTGSATGYSCTGTDTPTQGNAALTCSAGIAGPGGKTDYCCSL